MHQNICIGEREREGEKGEKEKGWNLELKKKAVDKIPIDFSVSLPRLLFYR